MDQENAIDIPFPETENVLLAMRFLVSFGTKFSTISLPDVSEVYDAFNILTATGCVEVKCILSAENLAIGQRLDAELRITGSICELFTVEGRRCIVWHAFDHAGWVDSSGAVTNASDVSADFSARITQRGQTVVRLLKNLKQTDQEENKASTLEEIMTLLSRQTNTPPRILYCRKSQLSETKSPKIKLHKEANDYTPITICAGSGSDIKYIDRQNIVNSCMKVTIRTLNNYDNRHKAGNPPERNGIRWAGVAIMAYEENKDHQPSKKLVNLYDMEIVRQFFGGIDSSKLQPRNVFLRTISKE